MFDRLDRAVQSAAFDLRSFVRPHHIVLPQTVRLKASPRVAQPKLNLADYVSAQAQPPDAVHRSNLGNSFLRDALGNTEWADCGDAMAIHGDEAFHLDAGTPVPPFVTGDALRLYSEVSGFDPNRGGPGQNPTDTGTDNQQLVDHWRDVGILCAGDNQRHKIAGTVWVDTKDPVLNRIAIWEFVVLFRALGLPKTAQSQTEWKLTDPALQGDAALGSWGYHDVPYFSYDSQRIREDSWGQPILVDWDFDKPYAVQGLVVVTTEMLNLRGVSPAGVDWTKLNADMAKFPPVPQS